VIPLLDLKTQHNILSREIDAAVARVITSGDYVLGPQVEAFEERFAAWCGASHCRAVNSGASALHLALLAAGVGPGDEVITSPMAFVATTAAIHHCGARPIYVDVDPLTWTIEPARIAAAITQRTKAIAPVHLHGLMAEMDEITAIARRHALVVIEDATQAHGAEYRGRRAGAIGDLGCFSFSPTKNLGACGEGGAVVTSNPELAKKISLLRDWGREVRHRHTLRGYNYGMDAIQGAVLTVKMDHIDAWTRARRAIAAMYDHLLADTPLGRPAPPRHCRHVYHVYAIRHPHRDAAIKALHTVGIGVDIHYPVPAHLQKAYEDPRFAEGALPVAERLAQEFVSLPIYPEMRPEQVVETAQALKTVSMVDAID